MKSIDGLKQLDLFANGDSALHALDPRAKVLVTLFFIVSIISFGKYEISTLLPYFIYPITMIALANLPPLFFVRKIALICPFIIAIGIFNPVFDREAVICLCGAGISGGWISFASILVRSVLTVGAAFILIGTTGFTTVCQALERMGMPKIFAVQLLFLYRYIFVLNDEGSRTSKARELRSCGRRGLGIKSYGSLVGHLLLRTWQKAERIHMAMLARGFTGEFFARRQSGFGALEAGFILGWGAFFVLMRLYNFPQLLGSLVTGIFT